MAELIGNYKLIIQQRQQGAFTGSGRCVYNECVLRGEVLPHSRYDFPNG